MPHLLAASDDPIHIITSEQIIAEQVRIVALTRQQF
jgi:hypothetical protein